MMTTEITVSTIFPFDVTSIGELLPASDAFSTAQPPSPGGSSNGGQSTLTDRLALFFTILLMVVGLIGIIGNSIVLFGLLFHRRGGTVGSRGANTMKVFVSNQCVLDLFASSVAVVKVSTVLSGMSAIRVGVGRRRRRCWKSNST